MRERVSGQLRLEVQEHRVFIEEATVARVWWEPAPLLVTDKIDKWGPLSCPALAISDRVLLSLFFFVTVPAERTWVSGGVGARASLLGVVAAGKVVKKKTQLPGRALGSTLSAREPSAGEHVEALADRGEETEVVSLGFNLPQEGAALGGSQHVEEGVLGQAQPADRAAPIIVHGTERGPCPFELLKCLDKAPDGPTPA